MRKQLSPVALAVVSVCWTGCGGPSLESGIPSDAAAGKAPDLPGMEVSIKAIQKKGAKVVNGPGQR